MHSLLLVDHRVLSHSHHRLLHHRRHHQQLCHHCSVQHKLQLFLTRLHHRLHLRCHHCLMHQPQAVCHRCLETHHQDRHSHSRATQMCHCGQQHYPSLLR